MKRAKYTKQAAEQQLDRADQELVYQAVQAYYGALLAQTAGSGRRIRS